MCAARPTLHDAHVHSHCAVLPVVVAIPSGCVGMEELLQHGSKDLRGYLVGLTFQSAMLCMGHRLDQRQCRDVHKWITRTPGFGANNDVLSRSPLTSING